jgi:2-dehydro-3-deoxyphosphogluconate aldolase/(4S)-4-hydroxy-2-oxoglutarate aldolase
MHTLLESIGNHGIVPVVKIEKVEHAIPLGKALIDGGLPVAEVTFRTSAAEEVIKKISTELPQMIVGAGTVLTIDQVKKAVNAGAKFIVSPGFNPTIVSYCKDNGILIVPGINSPSQLEVGMEMGLDVFKFFPAEESGGVAFLKAISAPYGNVKFMPTGGINQSNLLSYLALKNIVACGGSWMVKPELLSAGKFNEITQITKDAIQLMLGFEFAHLGINEENEKSATSSSNSFAELFNFKINDGASSIFTGQNAKEIEIMKKQYLGKKGHLAISTNSIKRALFYLDQKGIKELPDSRKEKDGVLKAVYLDKEISGFALHLLQK